MPLACSFDMINQRGLQENTSQHAENAPYRLPKIIECQQPDGGMR